MRRATGAIAFLVACASAALADPPKVPLPVTIPVHRDQVVTIDVDDADAVGVTPAFDPAACLFFRGYSNDKTKMVFLVRPYREGEFRVVFWTKGEITSSTLVINPGGVPPPVPPVPPGPNPPVPVPPGPLPDGELGLTKASREGFAKVTADRAQSAALARANRAHASAVAAGAFPTAEEILEGWREANRKALGLPKNAPAGPWVAWGNVVSPRLQELYKSGKLPTTLQWSAAFNEIADGLEGK